MGDFNIEYPLNRKTQISFPFKNKSMTTSWDDSENLNSEGENEEVNVYLMTSSDTKEVNISNSCYTSKTMEMLLDNLLEG